MTSTRVALLALLWMACARSAPEAVGTLVFTPEAVFGDAKNEAGAVAAAFFATEAEVLASTAIARRVVEEARLDGGVEAMKRAIHAKRRGESLVLDVRVSAADPRAAGMRCDLLLRAYLEGRLERHRQPHLAKAQWLAAELDNKPDPARAEALKVELRKAELASRLWVNDVRILEPCAVADARRP